MRAYRFDAEALEEYEAAAVYYTLRDEAVGRAFITAVEETIARSRRNPGVGARILDVNARHDLRRLLVPRFPFTVNYALIDETVYVLAVANTHRRLNYWRDRLLRPQGD